MGPREWFDEFWRVDKDGKVDCYWEMDGGYTNRVMEDVGVCILYWLCRWWQRRSNCCMARLLLGYWYP